MYSPIASEAGTLSQRLIFAATTGPLKGPEPFGCYLLSTGQRLIRETERDEEEHKQIIIIPSYLIILFRIRTISTIYKQNMRSQIKYNQINCIRKPCVTRNTHTKNVF